MRYIKKMSIILHFALVTCICVCIVDVNQANFFYICVCKCVVSIHTALCLCSVNYAQALVYASQMQAKLYLKRDLLYAFKTYTVFNYIAFLFVYFSNCLRLKVYISKHFDLLTLRISYCFN